MWQIASFRLVSGSLCALETSDPKCWTFPWAICAFLFETQKRASPSRFNKLTVASKQLSLLFAPINMPSTYWSKVISGYLPCHGSNSFDNTLPNRVGLFFKPSESMVQHNCIFLPVVRFSHSKAKRVWLCSATGMQKKASFKSRTEINVCLWHGG